MMWKRIASGVLCVVGGSIFLSATVDAAAPLSYLIRLDQSTVDRGYTVEAPDGSLRLGVRGGIFSEPSRAKIVERAVLPYPAPTGWELDGSAYLYDFSQTTPTVLSKVLWLTLSTSRSDGVLHFYDRVHERWQQLPSTYRGSSGFVQAPTPFPYSTVALFTPLPGVAVLPAGAPTGLTAASAFVMDPLTGTTLYADHADTPRSIASITKLMTGFLVLESGISLDQVVAMQSSDQTYGGRLYVSAGETLTVRDLFFSMLTGSANNAANALARIVGGDRTSFVQRMNSRAQQLGLTHTTFRDPSGLDAGNQSTAREVAALLNVALAHFDILAATTVPSYTFHTINTGIGHTIRATNTLTQSELYLLGGKTGFIDEAGYCLVVRARGGPTGSREVVAVVLGNPTTSLRFQEAERLLRWGIGE